MQPRTFIGMVILGIVFSGVGLWAQSGGGGGTAYVTPSSGGGSATTNASELTTGTLPDARLSVNVSLLGQSISIGTETDKEGSTITNANASTLFSSGVIPSARLTLDPAVFGFNSSANGAGQTAIGYSNLTEASGAVALGSENIVQASDAMAIGRLNFSTNNEAILFGFGNASLGQASVVIGNQNNVNTFGQGDQTVALGHFNDAAATRSVVVGINAVATNVEAIVISARTSDFFSEADGEFAVQATKGRFAFGGGSLAIDGGLTATGTNILTGIRYPLVDGSSNQVIRTDGAGKLSFGTVASGAGDVTQTGINAFTGTNTFNVSFSGLTDPGAGPRFLVTTTNIDYRAGMVFSNSTSGGYIAMIPGFNSLDASYIEMKDNNSSNARALIGVDAGGTAYIAMNSGAQEVVLGNTGTAVFGGGYGITEIGRSTYNGTNIFRGSSQVLGYSGASSPTNGTSFIAWRSATASLSWSPLTLAGDTESRTITVTGANTNNTVMLGPPTDVPTDSAWTAFVSAANTVTIARRAIVATASGNTNTWRASVFLQ